MIDPELPQVIVGACGCILPATALPVGFRFVPTPTGDKRQLVYGCAEHDRTQTVPVVPVKTKAAVRKPRAKA